MQILNQPIEVAQRALADNLSQLLTNGKKVLWLVPGGSNIAVVVWVMAQLKGVEHNLIVMLTDERYGEVGHTDSNWLQLAEAGFSPGQASVLPTLVSDLNLEETTDRFAQQLQAALDQADVTVGFFGMGEDGHIAGILPQSPAVQELQSLACGYATEQFTRITMTFAAIKRVDMAFCLAYGSSKQEPLAQLAAQTMELNHQPVQILKALPIAYVYNDQITE